MSVGEDQPVERLQYQVAVSNHMFNDDLSLDDLTCMNCLRVEMGERACYTGICDMCGETPPSLQWMYPDGPPREAPSARAQSGGNRRTSWRTGDHLRSRRRPPWLSSETRSSSTENRPTTSSSSQRRRLSVDSATVVGGVSPARIDLATFTHTYNRVVGIDSEGEDKDSTSCVICLSDFSHGDNVRRLACLHLFHVSCVDSWLGTNRCCPVCRVDIEAAAAQFR